MSFETQVEGLTGISIESSGTTPTQNELSQFLKDGVLDVTQKCIRMNPKNALKFQRTTSSDSQGVSVGGAQIISVMREANADGSSDGSTAWRICREIPAALQSRVVDTDSLHFSSIYNPVYTIENNNTVNVYPVPSSNDAMKILYVNEEPRDVSNDAALVFSHSNIKYFPNDKVYLVVLYATAMCCSAKAADIHNNFPIVPTLDYAYNDVIIPEYTPPVLDTYFVLPEINLPALVTPTLDTTTSFDLPATDLKTPVFNFTPNLDSLSLTLPTFSLPTLPDITLPALDFDLTKVNLKIGQEDIEIADKELDIVSKKMDKFDKDLKLSTERLGKDTGNFDKEFEKAKLEYEKELEKNKDQFDKDFQKALNEFEKDFQSAKSEYDGEWERLKINYQTDFERQKSEFDQEWDEDKIEYQTEFQNRIKVFEGEVQVSLQKYTKEFDRQALNYKAFVDEEIAEFQAELQIRFKNAEAKMALEVQRVQASIATYQHQIGKLTQEYNWWVGQYQLFMVQYASGFQAKSAPPVEQEQRRRKGDRYGG